MMRFTPARFQHLAIFASMLLFTSVAIAQPKTKVVPLDQVCYTPRPAAPVTVRGINLGVPAIPVLYVNEPVRISPKVEMSNRRLTNDFQVSSSDNSGLKAEKMGDGTVWLTGLKPGTYNLMVIPDIDPAKALTVPVMVKDHPIPAGYIKASACLGGIPWWWLLVAAALGLLLGGLLAWAICRRHCLGEMRDEYQRGIRDGRSDSANDLSRAENDRDEARRQLKLCQDQLAEARANRPLTVVPSPAPVPSSAESARDREQLDATRQALRQALADLAREQAARDNVVSQAIADRDRAINQLNSENADLKSRLEELQRLHAEMRTHITNLAETHEDMDPHVNPPATGA